MAGIYGKTMNVITTKPSAKNGSGHSDGKSTKVLSTNNAGAKDGSGHSDGKSTKVLFTNNAGAKDGSGHSDGKSSTKGLSTNNGRAKDTTNSKDDKRISGTQPLKNGTAPGQNGEKYHGSPVHTNSHGENPDKRQSGRGGHDGNAPVHKRNENSTQQWSGKTKCHVFGDSTGAGKKQNVGNNKAEAVEQIDAFKSDTFDPLHASITSEEEGDQKMAEISGDSKPNMAVETNTKTDDGAKPVRGDKIQTKKNIRLYQSAKMHMKKLVTHKNSKVRVLDEDIEQNAITGSESGHDNKFSPNLNSQEVTNDCVIQAKPSEGEKSGRCKIIIKALSSANRTGKCGGVYQGYSSTSLTNSSGGNLKDGSQTSREDKNYVSSFTHDENLAQNTKGKTEVATRELNSGKKARNNDSNVLNLKPRQPEVTGGALIEDVDTLETSSSCPAIRSTKSDALKTGVKLKPKMGKNNGALGPNMVLENITHVNKTPFLLDKPKLAWSSPPSKVHNSYDDSGNNRKNPTTPECVTAKINSGQCESDCAAQQEAPDQTSPSQVTSLHSFNEEADTSDVMLKGFTRDVKHVLNHGDADSFPRSANIETQNREKLKNNTKKMDLKRGTDKNVTSGTKVTLPAKENLEPNSSRASADEEDVLCGGKTQLQAKKAKCEAKLDQELKTLQVKTVEDCWKVFMQNEISKSCSGESGDNLQKHNPLSWALASQSTNSTLNNTEKSGDSAKVADGGEQQKREKGPSKFKKFKQIFTSSHPHNSWLPARHNFKPQKHKSAADEEARTKEKGHKVTPNMPGVSDAACDAAKTDGPSAGSTVTVRNVSTLTKTATVKSHKQLLEMFSVSNPTSANVS